MMFQLYAPSFYFTFRTNYYFGNNAYTLLAAYMANFKAVADDGWYLTSGATHHLTNNMENM